METLTTTQFFGVYGDQFVSGYLIDRGEWFLGYAYDRLIMVPASDVSIIMEY